MIRKFAALFAAILCASLTLSAHANDAEIASQIVQRLRTQQQTSNLRGFNIGVQVDAGTVTMLGQVADQSQAALALDIARRVPGVKLVVNDLAVGAAQTVAQTQPVSSAGGNVRLTAAGPQTQQQMVQPAIPTAQQAAAGTGVQAPTMQTAANPNQQPLAFAPTGAPQALRTASNMPIGGEMVGGAVLGGGMVGGGMVGGPAPASMGGFAGAGGGAGGVATASYDNAQMPGYAWPSYSAYPNYGAATYPQQYSAAAWPYIGPFYPYPQVPLGWRKVQLEWDDGWWFLDFKSK